MPRRGGVPKRDVLPDPLYKSKVVTKLINQVMYDGKKGVAQRIVYDAFDIINEKTGREAIEVFNQAMENIMPLLETKARRVGGSNYQVPIEVRPDRRQTQREEERRRTQDGGGKQGVCSLPLVVFCLIS